jgi:hypothetical protein
MCPPESQTKTIQKLEKKLKFEETCVVIEECDINNLMNLVIQRIKIRKKIKTLTQKVIRNN